MKKINRPDTPLTPSLPEHMKPYDTDGDGKLSPQERAAYNKAKATKAMRAKKEAQKKGTPSQAVMDAKSRRAAAKS